MPDVVNELLATEAAIGKLGARNISAGEAGQLPRNKHVTVCAIPAVARRETATDDREGLTVGGP